MLLAYGVARLMDLPLPARIDAPLLVTPIVFLAYLVGAIPEEIGWTAYATDPLHRRYGLLATGLLIGTVWALWHVVPWWLGQGHPLWWVAGQIVATILTRVIMVWMYVNGGRSLFLAIVFHATINTAYSLFPNNGSHYNPIVLSGVLLLLVATTGIVLTIPRAARPRPAKA